MMDILKGYLLLLGFESPYREFENILYMSKFPVEIGCTELEVQSEILFRLNVKFMKTKAWQTFVDTFKKKFPQAKVSEIGPFSFTYEFLNPLIRFENSGLFINDCFIPLSVCQLFEFCSCSYQKLTNEEILQLIETTNGEIILL